MRLLHDLGQSLSLVNPATDRLLWKYVYTGKPKPFFHPVATPAGHVLTNYEPHDHVWHRGMWFTIKFINGDNFWEENVAHGRQVTAAGPTVWYEKDGSVGMASALQWVSPAGKVVLEETRQIHYRPLSEDSYAFDWEIALAAAEDLLLDRTPYTTWGGYGGLIVRGTRNWQQTRILLSDQSVTDRPTGQSARWADVCGKLDGGPNATGGYAIFDHPSNLRHPTPMYGGAEKWGNYLNAAFLFHEPLRLSKGATLPLRYRVVIHDNTWDADRLENAWQAYTRVLL